MSYSYIGSFQFLKRIKSLHTDLEIIYNLLLQEKKYQKRKKKKRVKELIYASQLHYGSWCYFNYADFGTRKLFIELTESGADYCRVGASIAKPGRSGRSFPFIYLVEVEGRGFKSHLGLGFFFRVLLKLISCCCCFIFNLFIYLFIYFRY